jgi:hypothetical protein
VSSNLTEGTENNRSTLKVSELTVLGDLLSPSRLTHVVYVGANPFDGGTSVHHGFPFPDRTPIGCGVFLGIDRLAPKKGSADLTADRKNLIKLFDSSEYPDISSLMH